MSHASTSELTIYKNAVDNQISKRISSSWDEDQAAVNVANNSDEIGISDDSNKTFAQNNSLIEGFIADIRARTPSRSHEGESVCHDCQENYHREIPG